MTSSLPQLEQHRSDLLTLMLGLGDFRSGSIIATQGRCGNPKCRCRRHEDPDRHEPEPDVG